MLEVVGFSECCDQKFDDMNFRIETYRKQDRIDFNSMKEVQTKLRKQLGDSVKDIFVEIEDSVIRDELLNLLTTLNQTTLDQSYNMLVEKLV